MKNSIRMYVNSGHDVETASQMKVSIIKSFFNYFWGEGYALWTAINSNVSFRTKGKA